MEGLNAHHTPPKRDAKGRYPGVSYSRSYTASSQFSGARFFFFFFASKNSVSLCSTNQHSAIYYFLYSLSL